MLVPYCCFLFNPVSVLTRSILIIFDSTHDTLSVFVVTCFSNYRTSCWIDYKFAGYQILRMTYYFYAVAVVLTAVKNADTTWYQLRICLFMKLSASETSRRCSRLSTQLHLLNLGMWYQVCGRLANEIKSFQIHLVVCPCEYVCAIFPFLELITRPSWTEVNFHILIPRRWLEQLVKRCSWTCWVHSCVCSAIAAILTVHCQTQCMTHVLRKFSFQKFIYLLLASRSTHWEIKGICKD